jgi:hypothetical protein
VAGRNFIQRALEDAIKQITQDLSIEPSLRDDLGLDRDTQGLSGSPPIFETILKKIEQAVAFVPDLTFVGTRKPVGTRKRGKPTPPIPTC